jgi:two-component system sensor histidine kinase DegS
MVGFETQGPLSGMWSELRVYPSASGVSVYSRDISQRKDAEQRVLQAQEVERTRIARALHDEALQGLGDAIVLAMAADRAAMGSPATRQLVGVLQGVGERLRGAIYGLRLAAEERTPFAELVEQLVEEHRAMMMAETPIELARGDGIPEGSLGERGLEVLRVIGEALTNVRRHARARHVRVHVWGANAVLWAEVSDDGCGFEPSRPASPRHHGISGMHERARLLGGRLEVDTEPDGGTTVRLQMSLVDDAAREV